MDWSKIIKNYTLILLSVIGIIAIVWLSGFNTNLPAPKTRNNAVFINLIAKNHKELFDKSGSPIFKITKVEKPIANWYILRLSLAQGSGPTSILVVNDPHLGSEYMKIVIGPENKFSRGELLAKNVPNGVIYALQAEGDAV